MPFWRASNRIPKNVPVHPEGIPACQTVVSQSGREPPTSNSTEVRFLTSLSNCESRCSLSGPHCSTPGGIRTPNPQIRSLMLYPVELRVRQHTERNPAVSFTGLSYECGNVSYSVSAAIKRRHFQDHNHPHKTFVGDSGATGA